MREIPLSEICSHVDAIEGIQNDWMLVTSEHGGKTNTLTASWGGLGCLWRRKVAFIFIRPSRYTYGFIEGSGRFTLTFFDGHKEALGYLGRTSGRDVPDKIGRAGLTLIGTDAGPTFAEGRLMISCRVIYRDPVEREKFLDKRIDDEVNPDGNRSVVYVGEIERAFLI